MTAFHHTAALQRNSPSTCGDFRVESAHGTKKKKTGLGSLQSLTEGVDTTTTGGTLVFHLFGALAQFERDLIIERTQAGLKAAATRGRKGGRKPVFTPKKLEQARALISDGLTVREAAARLKISKTSLYNALRDQQSD